MKTMVKKTVGKGLGPALLELQNMPRIAYGLNLTWMFGRCQRQLAPASQAHYQQLSHETMASCMKKRLEEAELVKERGSVQAETKFHVEGCVVLQNPKSKERDLHGTVKEILGPRRYKELTKSGQTYARNAQYLGPSAQNPG